MDIFVCIVCCAFSKNNFWLAGPDRFSGKPRTLVFARLNRFRLDLQ